MTVLLKKLQIMKMKNVVIASISLLVLTACEEPAPPITMCDCIEFQNGMFKELGFEGLNDETKFEAFQTENKDMMDHCDSLAKDLDEELKQLTEEEQKAKEVEFDSTCAVYGEFKELMTEMRNRALEEMMKQQSMMEGLNLEDAAEVIDIEGLETE